MQSNKILIFWVFPLYFPQVANEHIKYVCVITIIVSYVARWRTVENFNEGYIIAILYC